MTLMNDDATPVQLIDHRAVEWAQVRQTRYWMRQRFRYQYPGSIRELRQRLVVIPADRYGDQRVCAFDLQVSAQQATTSVEQDAFGNRVFLVYVPEVAAEVVFEMRLVVERDLDASSRLQLTAEQAEPFRAATALTAPDTTIMAVARQLAALHTDPEQLCEAINAWVARAMLYGAGATNVATTAAQALAVGQGLCQDYAQIMLAICRTAGIAARYVSGHMLGEGGSHAWVEALLPDAAGGFRAVAFDPTNDRRTTPAYITVAVGRDYSDVSPTSGSYIAPYTGQLITSKRAGLTHLEYRA